MPKVTDLPVHIRPLITVALVIVVWWGSTATGWINPLFLPQLSALVKALVRLLSESTIYLDTVATLSRAILGLLLSFLVAVPLGLVFGRFMSVYKFLEFPVDFFRSIPASAIFFLFVLFFGIGDASKVAVVFYGCSLILLVNTVYGAKPTREKQDRINMLRSFGATPQQIFYLAVLPDAVPHIVAGLRVCVSLSLVLVVVTEMFLSANRGLGRRIYDFYLAYNIPEMYAAIIVIGLVGFGANKLIVFFERRICFWTS
jgi:ABC-type nitrate/sulfonate/bicarbonate transport system permease component